MSKVLRCDRCGEMIVPFLLDNGKIFITISELYFQSKKDTIDRTCADRKTDINLCSECTKQFITFMEDFKNEASYLSGTGLSFSKFAKSDPECIRGRYKYEGSSRSSNCEASEWTDDTQ